MQDWIGDDGTLHVLADPISLPSALKEIDVHQARLLQQVAGFWQRRSRCCIPSELLRPTLENDAARPCATSISAWQGGAQPSRFLNKFSTF